MNIDYKKNSTLDSTELFLWMISGYVILLVLAYALQSGLLKGLSYLAAFFIFFAMAFTSAFLPRIKNLSFGIGLGLALYYYGLIGSIAYNFHQIDWGVTFKLLMGPMFVFFGQKFESQPHDVLWQRPRVKMLFLAMLILPFLLWLEQLVTHKIAFGGEGGVSIFANRNNAALYTITLIALYNILSGKPLNNILIFLIAGFSFATIGVLLAVAFALLLTVIKSGLKSKVLFLLVLAMVIGFYTQYPTLGLFARFNPVVDSISLIVSGKINLATVTYGELVATLHTKDLSFIFRLKHWLDLLGIYSNGDIYTKIFGFGTSSSISLSESHLVPHNDYLRNLFECGLISFIGFISIIGWILMQCGRRWETVPLLAVIIYFFSENLVDNFVAMAIFYFCAGALAYRIQKEKLTPEQ